MSNEQNQQSLQELEALQHRLANDIQRSRFQDPSGLNRSSVLVQNLARVNEQIKEKQQGK